MVITQELVWTFQTKFSFQLALKSYINFATDKKYIAESFKKMYKIIENSGFHSTLLHKNCYNLEILNQFESNKD